MVDVDIKFFDKMLGTNELLVKSIIILYDFDVFDVIFIPNKEFVSMKIKGMADFCENLGHISHQELYQLNQCLKLVCSMNILETNIPQTGSFEIEINEKKYAIRAAFHPTNNGECLCLRIIKEHMFNKIQSVESLLKKGLNIIGGRTCSGKTTLMYATMLRFAGHIITLEDPVEFPLNTISQTDVSLMGFEAGINSCLRQNPDLICIGEIRDSASAKAAMKAALTGHFVLATIHIESPDSLKERLLQLDSGFFLPIVKKIFYMENFNLNII